MSQWRERNARALRYLRGAMAATALSLPLLSLSGFGIWWLWQNDWLLVWSVTASVVAVSIYGLEALLVWRSTRSIAGDATADGVGARTQSQSADEDPRGLTLREQKAWEAIESIAEDIDPAKLTDHDAIFQTGIDTVEAVARQMHPDEQEPLWKFTVPEALAVIERVSTQLNRFVVESIPLGDRMTVGQLLTLYRWRSLVTAAERAYDLWRILRFANPISAVAGEVREKVSQKVIEGMRDELLRRLARAYVREVGQAAIDLYSGRLRPDLLVRSDREQALVKDLEARPIVIMVAGQQGAGKSSLVLALCSEMNAVAECVEDRDDTRTTILKSEGDEAFSAIIVEAPTLDENPKRSQSLVERALDCDVVLAVVSAARPDRAPDHRLVESIREAYAERQDRRTPPLCAVLTHIDKLRPFREWAPPYDLNEPKSSKACSIRDATEALAEDLGVEVDDVIPVKVGGGESYNVEVLWAKLYALVPDARKAQLARHLSESSGSPMSWRQVLKQSANAGRLVTRTVTKGSFRKMS